MPAAVPGNLRYSAWEGISLMTINRAFVTGGSGFVGRNLIRELVASGCEVRALARCNKAAGKVEAVGATPILGDLDDIDTMQQAMHDCDVGFHAAALVTEWGALEDYHHANVLGTAHVLSAACAAKLPRLVHVSTEAVYADWHSSLAGLTEKSLKPLHPLPRYPASKSRAEDLVQAANCCDLQTMIIRPRFIWGLDDTSVLTQFVAAVHSGRFAWIDDGRALTSTCHVSNVVEGALLAAEKGRGGEAYFLTDGEPVTSREFITAMLATQDISPPNKSIPLWLARRIAAATEWSWENMRLRGTPPVTRVAINLMGQEVTVSDAKARRELGYEGRMSRRDGLAGIHKPGR